jgi:hypothetical protein
MRQAGRYMPEYRAVRERHSLQMGGTGKLSEWASRGNGAFFHGLGHGVLDLERRVLDCQHARADT